MLPNTLRENITSTLIHMGYQNRDIDRIMKEVPEEFQTVADILPFMIRELS
jgi:Holliday junction resolvasome RuvABC DNA-binding subunit